MTDSGLRRRRMKLLKKKSLEENKEEDDAGRFFSLSHVEDGRGSAEKTEERFYGEQILSAA